MVTDPSVLRDRLEAMVGRPMGRGAACAADPVNLPMIRQWAAAFDDRNPAYLDAAAAASSLHGAIVAPPAMLQTWIMATPTLDGIGERGGHPTDSEEETPLTVLHDAGFTGALAVESALEIERYLHLDELVTSSNEVESISDEKQTRLGPGIFVTWVTTYRVGAEVVGRQRFRLLKYKPGAAP